MIMLAASLRQFDKEKAGCSTRSRVLLCAVDISNAPLRAFMEQLAQLLGLWGKVLWVDELEYSEPEKERWPFPVGAWREGLLTRASITECQDLWFPHFYEANAILLTEAFPSARLHLYEDGLLSTQPESLQPFGQALQLLLKNPGLIKSRVRFGLALQHERIFSGGVPRRALKRLVHRFSFLGHHYPVPFPFQNMDECLLSKEHMQTVLKQVRASIPDQEFGSGEVLFLSMGFHRLGIMERDVEERITREVLQVVLSRGYQIRFKDHPRDTHGFAEAMEKHFGSDKIISGASLGFYPVEVFAQEGMPEACVAMSSSSLDYLPMLYDTPCYSAASFFVGQFQSDMLQLKAIVASAAKKFPSISEMPDYQEVQ